MVLKNLDLSANARSERVAPAQIVWSSNIWTMPEMRRDSVQGCQFSMSSMKTLSSAMLLTAMCSTARNLRTMASAVRVSEAASKEMSSLSLTISVEVASLLPQMIWTDAHPENGESLSSFWPICKGHSICFVCEVQTTVSETRKCLLRCRSQVEWVTEAWIHSFQGKVATPYSLCLNRT